MIDIQSRLTKVLRDGNLTVADLSLWFGRPYHTVRGWTQGHRVGGAQLDAAFVVAELGQLEKRIKRRQGFPVPRMSKQDRPDYIRKQRNGR